MRIPVAIKLAIGYGCMVLIIGAVMLIDIQRNNVIEGAASDIFQEGVVVSQDLGDARTLLQRIRSLVFNHVATDDSDQMRQLERDIVELEAALQKTLNTAEGHFAENDERRRELVQVRELYSKYARVRDSVILPASHQNEEATTLRLMGERSRPLFDATDAAIEKVIGDNIARNRALYDAVQMRLVQGQQTAITLGILVMVVAILIAWLTSRGITRRLTHVSEVANAVRQGHTGRRAQPAGNDEITDLAHTFNRMTDDLAERLSEQTAQKQLLAETVSRYREYVDKLANGDLGSDVEVRGDGDLGSLGHNLRTMGHSLRDMTMQIHESVGELTSASAEILATTQEQAASSTESASAVTETVATVEEVVQSAHQAAKSANHVAERARESLQVSAQGRSAVKEAVDSMEAVQNQVSSIAERILRLAEQAQAVGRIITSVNELAEQSNLLALNASIEAARAGEEGRGFAIVAQEIRALAEQSRQATGEVSTILNDIQRSTSQAVLATEEGNKAVTQAVQVVRMAGDRIEVLGSAVSESASAAENIASAVDEQVQGMSQISDAMHSINQAYRQTVEGTRQTESAARSLNELSIKLREAASRVQA